MFNKILISNEERKQHPIEECVGYYITYAVLEKNVNRFGKIYYSSPFNWRRFKFYKQYSTFKKLKINKNFDGDVSVRNGFISFLDKENAEVIAKSLSYGDKEFAVVECFITHGSKTSIGYNPIFNMNVILSDRIRLIKLVSTIKVF